jgi:predicted dehydrogenase
MLTGAVFTPVLRAQARTRIGFVDDNLENYHANTFLTLLRGPLQSRGFTVTGCTGLQEAAGRAWATKNNVPYVADVTTLNQSVDAFMVMAPSTPDTHAELCRRVFPFKKPTYVDKTFAPDLATARELFALAGRSGTPMQTTSVLRYTNVQDEVRKTPADPVEHMTAWGNGGSFGEYAVHPLELLVSIMGPEVETLMRRGEGDRSQLLLNFSRGRTGTVNVYTNSSTPFAATLTTRKGTRHILVEQGPMFQNSLAATLDFFTSGNPTVPAGESLAIMGILDAARSPDARQRFVPVSRS